MTLLEYFCAAEKMLRNRKTPDLRNFVKYNKLFFCGTFHFVLVTKSLFKKAKNGTYSISGNNLIKVSTKHPIRGEAVEHLWKTNVNSKSIPLKETSKLSKTGCVILENESGGSVLIKQENLSVVKLHPDYCGDNFLYNNGVIMYKGDGYYIFIPEFVERNK